MEGLLQNSFLPIVLMFGVLYFFMIRPQLRRQKQEKRFSSELKKGDKIITKSGIHGKVIEINQADDTCVVETLAGKIKFERTAISMELSAKLNAPVSKK